MRFTQTAPGAPHGGDSSARGAACMAKAAVPQGDGSLRMPREPGVNVASFD